MSGDGLTDFDWADGRYEFRLGVGELRQLQEKTGVGPYVLYTRVKNRSWLIDDLRETIRLGLIGAGMEPVAALNKIKFYVDKRPKVESVEPALRILIACLIGVPGDPVGKPVVAGNKDRPMTTAESPSPPSTE